MKQLQARFVGVERYFEDSAAAKNFYVKTLGLAVADQQTGNYAKFQAGGSLRLPGTKRD
jgi:predicted enzyme related to lactoylglutathione lyase